MNFLNSIGELLAAADNFLMMHARDLPDAARAAILEASAKVSPVDRIVGLAEALYAAREGLAEDGLIFAAQTAEFATRHGWHGLSTDARGSRMIDAIRRQLGEPHPTGGEWPAPETDPVPAGMIGVVPLASAMPGPST